MTAFHEKLDTVETLENLLAGLDLVNLENEDEGPIFQTNVYTAMRSLESDYDLEMYITEYITKSKLYQDRVAEDNQEVTEQDKWVEVVADFCESVSYALIEAAEQVDRVTLQKWIDNFETQLLASLKAYYGEDKAAQITIAEILTELDETKFQVTTV